MNSTFAQDEDLLSTAVPAVLWSLGAIRIHATDTVNPRLASNVNLLQVGGDDRVLKGIAKVAANHVKGYDSSFRRETRMWEDSQLNRIGVSKV